MEITGTLEAISETNQVSDKFKKREFVLEVAENPQYPEFLKMEFIQDKCDFLNEYSVDDEVRVQINLKGRKYEHPEKGTMYFNTLQAWKIEKDNYQATPQPNVHADISTEEDDILPF